MLDVIGPGCIDRIWFTAQDYVMTGTLRIYFDRATTPTVQMTMRDFFSGTQSPFLYPLAGNNQVSAGGFYCCVPMPFRTGCKITTTNAATMNYFNVSYYRLANDAGITTFTGAESVATAMSVWSNAGTDPKPDGGTQVLSGTVNLPVGGSSSIATIGGAGTIQRLELTVPGLSSVVGRQLTDLGRVMLSGSVWQFRVNIAPTNAGVRLVRRTDHGVSGQSTTVFVDGQAAGTWSTPGSRIATWLDSAFWIPSALTAGKSTITVQIRYPTSTWAEYHYEAYSLVGAQSQLTDEIDVGDAADRHLQPRLHGPLDTARFAAHRGRPLPRKVPLRAPHDLRRRLHVPR